MPFVGPEPGAPPLAEVSELETLLQRSFTEPESDAALLALGIASDAIRTFTRQTLSVVTDDVYVADADGVFELWLPERPVLSVTSVTVDGVVVSPASYTWRQSGRIRFPWGLGYLGQHGYFIGGDRAASVVYSHGFEIIPGDIKRAALLIGAGLLGNPDSEDLVMRVIDREPDTNAPMSPWSRPGFQEQALAPLIGYRPVVTSVAITSGSW
jgi:hypothetical protein